MSVFSQPFMFFDNPRGGTDQMDKAKSAGFAGGFGNVIDYAPEAWDAHRASARANGMWFGTWGRTGHPPPQGVGFEQDKARRIRDTAVSWGLHTPYVINCEKEIDNSGATITSWLASLVKPGEDAALSCEAWPFGAVDWGPVGHLPVLPQIFPQDWWASQMWDQQRVMKRANESKAEWHRRGVKCVWFTFGTYGLQTPGIYDLKAPYSLYTADAIGIQNYGLWKPTSSGFVGCVEPPKPPTPKPPSTADTREMMELTAKHWEDGQKVPGPKPLTRITIAKEIVRLNGISDASWRKHAPTFRALVDQAEAEE